MIKKIGIVVASLCLGFFLTAGIPLLAQTTSPTQPNPAQTSPRSTSPTRPNSATPESVPSQAQLTEIDKQYMLDANRNAVAALALGQLALNKAESQQVKQFVQAEIDEQTQVRSQLSQIAPTVGVNLPTAPTPKDQEVAARFSRLSGAQFDRAVLDELGINAHLENAAIYQREAGLGQNRDLVELATQGLSLITQHYNTASALTGYQVAQVPARVEAGTPSSGLPQSRQNSTTPR